VAKRATRKQTRKRKAATRTTAPRKTAARAAASRSRKKAPAPKKPSTASRLATMAKGAAKGVAARVGKGEDALQLLEREHRRFEDLLKQGEETTDRARKGRKELLKTITTELNAHELMEEKVLYPALQSHPQAREIVLEGYEEHHVADLIVAELKEVATNNEQWGAKWKVLKENIEHHIQEEEGQMFRLARGLFSRNELMELGDRMRSLRRS
jgi:hemerythrin-like domain-containing protein